MNRNYRKGFLTLFIKTFIILLIIVVLLPYAVDILMYALGEKMAPGENSVKVFRNMLIEREALSNFVNIVRKLIIFM